MQSKIGVRIIHGHALYTGKYGTPGGNFTFGGVFFLKMTISFKFVPSARHKRMTVKQDFSWPVVLIETVFSPHVVTVLTDGMSNQTGVSSILPMLTSS